MGRQQAAVVRVPASTANLGPGFDSLGLALGLYIKVEMSVSKVTEIVLDGPNLEGIPVDKTNLVYQTAQSLFESAGCHYPELYIRMSSEIPLTRGLGSSAAAIVAALVAANRLAGDPFSQDRLFQIAAQMEQHPDNVGASLFGGFIVAVLDQERAEYLRFDPPPKLSLLAVVPRFELSTKQARGVLPSMLSREDAVFNLSHTGLLVASLVSGKLDRLAVALRDRIHQPYRFHLVPGMEKVIRGVSDYGAYGAVLSGAGPTLLVFHEKDAETDIIKDFIRQTFSEEGIEADLWTIEPCLSGAEVVT